MLEGGGSLGADPLLNFPRLETYGNYDKKGPMYSTGAEYFQLLCSSGLCGIYAISFAIPTVELLAPLTGWDMNWAEGLKTGHRILTLRQAFNAREGITPDLFQLPKRLSVPHTVGPATGAVIDFDTLKKGYFEAMGWDIKTGKPNPDTLVELGLDKLVK